MWTVVNAIGMLRKKCSTTCPYKQSQYVLANPQNKFPWRSLTRCHPSEFNFHITFNWFPINFHIFLSLRCSFFLHSSLWCSRRFMLFSISRDVFSIEASKEASSRGEKKYKYLFRLPLLPPSELKCLLSSAWDRSCVCTSRSLSCSLSVDAPHRVITEETIKRASEWKIPFD